MAVQNETEGGPYTLVAVLGMALTSSASGTNGEAFAGAGCQISPAPGSPSAAPRAPIEVQKL